MGPTDGGEWGMGESGWEGRVVVQVEVRNERVHLDCVGMWGVVGVGEVRLGIAQGWVCGRSEGVGRMPVRED